MRGGDVDDPAPALLRASCGSAAAVVWKAELRLMAMIVVPPLGREVLDRRDVLDAGIVDEDVDPPHASRVPRPARGNRRPCAMSRGDVACAAPVSVGRSARRARGPRPVGEGVEHDVRPEPRASSRRCRGRSPSSTRVTIAHLACHRHRCPARPFPGRLRSVTGRSARIRQDGGAARRKKRRPHEAGVKSLRQVSYRQETYRAVKPLYEINAPTAKPKI